jgi:AcrR family transcriptional regulator
MATKKRPPAKKRSHGIAARDKILDAAGEIASERGYEGTSISLVSKRSGLPASSIYWHFKDKDDLISAVIERSFNAWLQALIDFGPADEDASTEEFVAHQTVQSSRALAAAPDFLRLGLMLGLEQRPEEPTARRMFLNVRSQAFQNAVKTFRERLPDLDRKSLEKLASFTIALADGCFISQQVADKTIDLMKHHELQAAAILGVINHLRSAR